MRLDELVASAFQGELEIDVHRVTPVNGSGKSQFRGIVNYANGSGIVHQGVLDLLVNGAEADVSFDTMYVDTIPIPSNLGINDSFPVTYVSHHETEGNGRMPIKIISIGKSEGEETAPLQKIEYASLTAESDGLVMLLPNVAIVDREMLENRGLTEGRARDRTHNSKKYGFLRYNAVVSGKMRTQILVPYEARTVFFGDKEIEQHVFSGVRLIPKERLEKYCKREEISLPKKVSIPEIRIEDVSYVPASVIDLFKTTKRSQRGHPKGGEEVNASVQYTLEEKGLITVVKEIAELDRIELWTKTKIKSQGYAGQVLRRETERHGFVDYATHTKTGSLKRVTLVPKGSEERIYKGLTFDTFIDLELIAKESVQAYTAEKGHAEINPIKASVIRIQGREYYLASQIEEIMKEEQGQVSKKEKKQKVKKEEEGKPLQPSLEGTAQIKYHTITRTVNGIEIYVMKDVATVSRELLLQKGLTDNQTQGALYDSVKFRGFVNYESRTNGKRIYVLVPKESVGVFRKDLVLEEEHFRNIELLAEESVAAYVKQYVTGENEAIKNKIKESQTMRKDGKIYVLKESIDAILKEVGIDSSVKAETRDKAKGERKKKDASVDTIINIHEYRPLGTTEKNVYTYDGKSAPLFDEAENVVKYGEIFNPFTPEHLTGGARSTYQDAMRDKILRTTAAKDRRDKEGNPVPETEVGRGKKHYLETKVANLCIMYLVDQGYTMPAKVE